MADARARDETVRRSDTARQLEAEHAAETVEQLAGAEMVRMAFQTRIVDSAYRAMLFHPSRDLERTFVLMADAHREGLHPAME